MAEGPHEPGVEARICTEREGAGPRVGQRGCWDGIPASALGGESRQVIALWKSSVFLISGVTAAAASSGRGPVGLGVEIVQKQYGAMLLGLEFHGALSTPSFSPDGLACVS